MIERTFVAPWWAGVTALTLRLAAPAQAQGAPQVHVTECLTARPIPKCDAFWITELDGAIPVTRRGWHDVNVAWELGYMVNRSRGPALGASLFAQAGHGDYDGVGLRPRARWWLTDRTSLDIGPGVLFASEGRHRVAFSALAALNTRVGALSATWLSAPALAGRQRNSVFVGVRAGGWPGLILGAALATYLGLALVAGLAD